MAKEIKKASDGGVQPAPLEIRISSFSYKSEMPKDPSGNGGGFVFDCRCLPNPGRLPEYKELNGRDAKVKTYLEKEATVKKFRSAVFSTIDLAVEKYIERSFTHLVILFGCTGGQHRSVYFTEQTAAHLREKFRVNVTIDHSELRKRGEYP